MTIYYTYLIRNNITKQKYIGTRTCPEHKTPELDNSYFGSGVLIREDIDKLGKGNFTKRILKRFTNRAIARQHEAEIHNTYNVANNDDFYNLKTEPKKAGRSGGNKTWYNNGVIYTKFNKGSEPSGFVKGILSEGEWVKNYRK